MPGELPWNLWKAVPLIGAKTIESAAKRRRRSSLGKKLLRKFVAFVLSMATEYHNNI
jgi:hypothetical protein